MLGWTITLTNNKYVRKQGLEAESVGICRLNTVELKFLLDCIRTRVSDGLSEA